MMARIAMTYRDVAAANVEQIPFAGLIEHVDGASYVIPNTSKLRSTIGPLFGTN